MRTAASLIAITPAFRVALPAMLLRNLSHVSWQEYLIFLGGTTIGVCLLLYLCILPGIIRKARLRRLLQRQGFENIKWDLPAHFPRKEMGTPYHHFWMLQMASRGGFDVVAFDYESKSEPGFSAVMVRSRDTRSFKAATDALGYEMKPVADWLVYKPGGKFRFRVFNEIIRAIP